MNNDNTRLIEMYVGLGEDYGKWYTTQIGIPADTPEPQVEETAINALWEEFEDSTIPVEFIGVFNIPELIDREDLITNIKLKLVKRMDL